ncbi:hypothetical protein B0O99DRAFT_613657 [Bisporella sp. PMI_857]|nr:hypothetical protein B0O99DRAFT_613657 [Bisporella sp. PMI_857]
MSKVRGIFPLFIAASFGIVNGIWVFGPSFKEQQQEKLDQERKVEETIRLSNEGLSTRDAEASASRTLATDTVLRAEQQSNWWFPKISLWSQESKESNEKIESNSLEVKRKQEATKGT